METDWNANTLLGNHRPCLMLFTDFNNEHLANVYQLLNKYDGSKVHVKLLKIKEIAQERKLSDEFMNTFHPVDKTKLYIDYNRAIYG